jgi:hypothetical protein
MVPSIDSFAIEGNIQVIMELVSIDKPNEYFGPNFSANKDPGICEMLYPMKYDDRTSPLSSSDQFNSCFMVVIAMLMFILWEYVISAPQHR